MFNQAPGGATISNPLSCLPASAAATQMLTPDQITLMPLHQGEELEETKTQPFCPSWLPQRAVGSRGIPISKASGSGLKKEKKSLQQLEDEQKSRQGRVKDTGNSLSPPPKTQEFPYSDFFLIPTLLNVDIPNSPSFPVCCRTENLVGGGGAWGGREGFFFITHDQPLLSFHGGESFPSPYTTVAH